MSNPQPSHAIPRIEFDHEACQIPELRMVGWTLFPEADTQGLTEHQHPEAFEICYMVKGEALWWVEHEILEVEPGDVYITWPGELHGGVDGAMQPCELYWLQLVIPERGSTLDMSEAETAALYRALTQLPRRKSPGPRDLQQHYRRVLQELQTPHELSAACIRASIRLLCADVLTAFSKHPAGGSSVRRYSKRIHEAIHWLQAHLGDQVSMTEVADAVGLSSGHFRTAFRQETGFSPIAYLTHLRMRAARLRLAQSADAITDIAFSLGFSSSQYFATVFRKHTGLAPGEYRARRQGADGRLRG